MNYAKAPGDHELNRLIEILGPAAELTYAPPNIYPMSAPRFANESGARRPRLDGSPLGLYVHIPFCNYHCNFCFYATKTGATSDQMGRYVDALIRELALVPSGTPLTQMYVGGGTPTALPAELLDQVLENVFNRYRDQREQVHTVECSPESLTDEHLDVLRRRGVERVSMGVQTLSAHVLDAVERKHSAAKALDACRRVLASERMLNVDLIYGLPGQSQDGFARDVEVLADIGAHSVTFYNLRVNERTPIARRLNRDDRLDLAALVDWRARIRAVAAEHGFEPARWHTFRRRNVTTAAAAARFEDRTGAGNQFGIGMSARSRLNHVVYRNHSTFDVYLRRIEQEESPVEQLMPLDAAEQRLRYIALTLGDGKPLPHRDYLEQFGTSLADDFATTLGKLKQAELVSDENGEVTMTASGQLVYDLVMRAFYPESIRAWLDNRQGLVRKRFPVSDAA
jgi:oxygen-independent coproporphyrinogen III oxidase